MHKITRQWIFEHRTPAGSWTRDQIEALGIQWPPRNGWIDRSEGHMIHEDQKTRFEAKKPRKIIKLERGSSWN